MPFNKSENVTSADNQQGTLLKNKRDTSETTSKAPQITKTYILGLLGDSTERKYTFRISQKGIVFPNIVKNGINFLGFKAWVYKEGKNRDVFVVEFSKKVIKGTKIKTKQEIIDYISGFFDAEGGISKLSTVLPYIYFCQKDYEKLFILKKYLTSLNIFCGKIHNPSKKVDPEYWRFYISRKSLSDFYGLVESRHPEKSMYLRMKI